VSRPHSDTLTPEEMALAGLLADTDLPVEVLARRFGVSVTALHRHKTRVYQEYGIHSRAGLRAAMLALELAPVGAR